MLEYNTDFTGSAYNYQLRNGQCMHSGVENQQHIWQCHYILILIMVEYNNNNYMYTKTKI